MRSHRRTMRIIYAVVILCAFINVVGLGVAYVQGFFLYDSMVHELRSATLELESTLEKERALSEKEEEAIWDFFSGLVRRANRHSARYMGYFMTYAVVQAVGMLVFAVWIARSSRNFKEDG